MTPKFWSQFIVSVIFTHLFGIPTVGLNLQDFKMCISANGQAFGRTCQLDPKPGGGPYIIGDGAGANTGTIYIERGNIDVIGLNVTLKREPGSVYDYYTGPLLSTSPSYWTQYIYIRDFTVDGNRNQNPVGVWYAGDVELRNTSNSTLSNVRLQNSPRISLAVMADTVWPAVQYCIISGSYEFGIWVEASSGQIFDSWSSSYLDNGANGLSLSRSGDIKYNTFLRNHRRCPYQSNGGQVLIEPQAYGPNLDHNVIADGPAYCDYPNQNWWADGIEAYGSQLTLTNNTVTNNGGHGIQLGGVQGAWVKNTDTATYVRYNNRRGLGFSGIWVGNVLAQNANITIESATAVDGHQYGITFQNNATNSKAIYNCVRGNISGGVYICPGCTITNYGNRTSGCGP